MVAAVRQHHDRARRRRSPHPPSLPFSTIGFDCFFQADGSKALARSPNTMPRASVWWLLFTSEKTSRFNTKAQNDHCNDIFKKKWCDTCRPTVQCCLESRDFYKSIRRMLHRSTCRWDLALPRRRTRCLRPIRLWCPRSAALQAAATAHGGACCARWLCSQCRRTRPLHH